MLEKLSKKLERSMPSVAIAPSDLNKIAAFHGNKKAWFSTIARKTGISPRKVKSIYYSEPHRLWASDAEAIQQAIHGHHKEAVRLLDTQGNLTNETINELGAMFVQFLEAYRRSDSDRR
jgi:hypothetical protein